MKILVTGASGFLGMNLLQHLAASHPEATIVAADLLPPAAEDLATMAGAARIAFEPLEVRDPRLCLDVLSRSRPAYVVHAAAVTLPEPGSAAAQLTHSVNLLGTENLLKAAMAAGSVQRFLLLSSSGVYRQDGDKAVCDEEHALELTGAYAQAKRGAELLMEAYQPVCGFSVVAARVGPAYGRFERRRATRPLVSHICRVVDALRSGECLRVAGSDMYRDWTHAADISAGLQGLLFSPGLNDSIYNVSAGQAISAREVLTIACELGLALRWTSEEEADLVLDPRSSRKPLVIERLRRDTGFQARFDIRAGLTDCLLTVPAVC